MRTKIASIFLALILVILVSSPSIADIREILTFRDVELPWTLKHGNIVMEKGTYDVLLIKHGVEMFCLKIRKNGKTLCLIKDPAKIKYGNQDNLYEMLRDTSVPKEAILRIKRNPTLNVAYLLIETGNCRDCPFRKLRFQVKSLET